jgi:hypothetical protein
MTRLIPENLSTVMDFAFARKPLQSLLDQKFRGEWNYLRKALFDVSEQRAAKA